MIILLTTKTITPEPNLDMAEQLQACKRAMRNFQNTLVETSKAIAPRTTWLIWILSRVYIRSVKKTSTGLEVSYNFFLMK